MGGADVPDDVLAKLHPLETKVLPHLKDKDTLSKLAKRAGMQEVEAMRALQWLENKGALKLERLTSQEIILGKNATVALEKGLPEERFYAAVKKKAMTLKEVGKTTGLSTQELGAAIGILKSDGVISMDGGKRKMTLSVEERKNYSFGSTKRLLKKVEGGIALEELTDDERELIAKLQKRKEFIQIKEHKDRKILLTQLGKALAKVDTKKLDFADQLTRKDLESGAWKKRSYRAYDVTINVPHTHGGKRHFVQEAIEYIRRIWVEMGFREMSGKMSQSAFWDLDALFVPQDHPARELQDTFYLDQPSHVKDIDKHAYERVRDAHEHGGTSGSKGWRYEFSRKKAEQLMLRTHTTVLSAQTLWAIRNGEAAMPGKYFTVGKVFRNERLDWKHLFEFHQVEGIVVDKDVSFAQLLGYLRIFFSKMGYPKIRTRPSYFPYTEPSVEVDVWHPQRKEWVELGGAGVFRPEVTKTLLGEEVPVLAWGLGLERIIVDYFGIEDLRDLYRNDIKQMQEMRHFVKIPGEDDG